MHELSIALSLVDAVCEELPRLGEKVSIRRVLLHIGPLAGVSADALACAFEIASSDSPIAGARLEIEQVDGRALEIAALEVVDAAADC